MAELEEAQRAAETEAYHRRKLVDDTAQPDVTSDVGASRARLEGAQREALRHGLALALAQQARRRIVRRVLPETEVYMRALLPELTAGRYRDARLLADDANGAAGGADLKIALWDEVAGRHVAKGLFSGGTRDQVSLALRLAFALATLPKELGAMPGFIVLDEPLSSFDDERAQALVHVLTEGTIGRAFPQVLLIAHSRSFDRAACAYSLRMAGGRVVESSLPEGRQAEALWQAEAMVAVALHSA
jgi:DNA repair exonuclease SbcCD ATPase subunit